MSFGTSLRVAADPTQPLTRRVINLVNAIERFQMFGFHGTFAQLHLATGSKPRDWSAEQVDMAARMLAEAHASWRAWKTDRDLAVRLARRLHPAPVLPDRTFAEWRRVYLDAEHAAQWRVSVSEIQ